VVTRLRQSGYRLLGTRFDYLLHTRPSEWPIVAAHATVGYLLAVGVAGAARGTLAGPAGWGILLWVACLNGGTLALNSAYDRDEGDIAYLRRPPPPPSRLAGFGVVLMVAGLAGAFLLPARYRLAYAVCLLLSLLYSVPPVRLKAVPGADWLVNMVGFGTLTAYAGWAATGLPVTGPGRWVLLAFCPLFAALYPLTQIYQFEEDARRGDRTLARSLGIRRSLLVASLAAVVAFALFGAAAYAARWSSASAWRWASLGAAALAWTAVLAPWLRLHRDLTAQEHQRGMYRALVAWAVTDAAVVLAWGV
jgi:lycopene elongase/hydratase (dihydrobisanhydrobacterioruberin-forming)